MRKAIFKEFVGNKIVLHAYVNNAAMAYDDIVTNLNLDRLKAMYDVNVFTPMMMTKYAIRNMLLRIYKRTSMKAATSVRSVAETVAFLVSEKACSITGQNVHVDNGTI